MTDQAMSPLRRRMIEDMTIRKFAAKTQHDYLQRVKNFATFLGRSPDTASVEDVRRYQLHLTGCGVGVPTLNQTVSTLRFFFTAMGKDERALNVSGYVYRGEVKYTDCAFNKVSTYKRKTRNHLVDQIE